MFRRGRPSGQAMVYFRTESEAKEVATEMHKRDLGNLKGTEHIISRDPLFKKGQALLPTVRVKPYLINYMDDSLFLPFLSLFPQHIYPSHFYMNIRMEMTSSKEKNVDISVILVHTKL